MCLDDRCRRLDAFDASSALVSFVTKFQMSWGDSSPSSFHLRLDRLLVGMLSSTNDETLRGVTTLALVFAHLLTGEIIKEV